MALTSTTLASAKGTNDIVINLTSATGAAKKMLALVDGEFMRITDVSLSPVLLCRPRLRWDDGRAARHAGARRLRPRRATSRTSVLSWLKAASCRRSAAGKDGAITGCDGHGRPGERLHRVSEQGHGGRVYARSPGGRPAEHDHVHLDHLRRTRSSTYYCRVLREHDSEPMW